MRNNELRRLIDGLVPTEGMHEIGIEGVQLFRVSHPIERIPTVYTPVICMLVNGTKRAYLGDTEHIYNPENYFCCTMPMPIETEIQSASIDDPVLGMLVSLETSTLAEIAIEFEATNTPLRSATKNEFVPGLAVVEKEALFNQAVFKMLQLVGDRKALDILGKGRLREVFYAVLMGGAGSMVRQTFGVGNNIAKSIKFVRENIGETITIEDMAGQAGMSRAVFHRKFKDATTLSPLQFVKSLKLNDAAMHIASGMTISEAALQSGYASTSQFSREFKRQYGASPRQWSNSNGLRTDTQSLSH